LASLALARYLRRTLESKNTFILYLLDNPVNVLLPEARTPTEENTEDLGGPMADDYLDLLPLPEAEIPERP